MSIICKPIEHKIELMPWAILCDFRLAPPEFQGIEFDNVNLRLVVPGDPGVDGDLGVVQRWFPWLRSLQQMKKDLLLAFDVGTS
ncbi:MAG TPA: hypothetical protein VE641_12170, partial [Chthoniobacterales bacterium]|nr:hypothetical protein [Chthoniobacterales bacterium]